MSYLERLLLGAEVEWTVIGDDRFFIIENNKRRPVRASLRVAGKVPYYGANNIQDYVEGYTHEGEYVLIAEDGAASIQDYSIQYVQGKFWANNHVHVIATQYGLMTRFMFHYLRVINFQPFLSGGQRAKLTRSMLQNIPIPIPPLSVQRKIVEILDTFTELIKELTKELTMRKQQYEYYREQLLTFEKDEVEWKTIDEVFSLRNGYTPSKSKPEYWSNGTIPWFRMDDIRENGRVLNSSIQYVNSVALRGRDPFPPNSLIIATSATIGEHALITVPFLCNQRFTCLTLQEAFLGKLDMKYLFYYSFILGEWCQKNTTISNFPSVDMNRFRKFLIPIPPMEEQERIVGILDKFDTLTTSITEGLPKEIELRQKQYEYYRDMLLSFPKADK